MGDECFCLECSKACDQQKWKNPHSCCLLECTAAFPEEPASPKTFFCLFFFSLPLSWVTTFCLWISFARLHPYCHVCGCWGLVREVVPCWHLVRNKKTAFPLCVRPLTGTGSKSNTVKCPSLCTGHASCILQSEINITSLGRPNSFALR